MFIEEGEWGGPGAVYRKWVDWTRERACILVGTIETFTQLLGEAAGETSVEDLIVLENFSVLYFFNRLNKVHGTNAQTLDETV